MTIYTVAMKSRGRITTTNCERVGRRILRLALTRLHETAERDQSTRTMTLGHRAEGSFLRWGRCLACNQGGVIPQEGVQECLP